MERSLAVGVFPVIISLTRSLGFLVEGRKGGGKPG